VDADREAMACGASGRTINALNEARRIVDISGIILTDWSQITVLVK
jgi:hypothetical protein